MRLAWLGLAIGLAAAASSSAFAKEKAGDPTAEAKVHFAKAKTLYKQARYREAISELQIAYKIRPHGVLLFNIAQAYEKLGEIPEALRNFHEYLRQVPDADDRATVEAAMGNLEKRLAEKGVQQVLVYSEPPGATVLIDGKSAGAAPFAAELPLGPHKVGVEISGYQLKARDVVVTADHSLVLDFTLEKVTEAVPLVAAPEPAPPPLGTQPPPPVAAPLAAVDVSSTAVPAPVAPPPKGRLWTWVAAGVAGAAVATGVGFGVSAKSAGSELLGSKHDAAKATALRDQAVSNSGTANVLYGVAGVAGAAGVALFFIEGRF